MFKIILWAHFRSMIRVSNQLPSITFIITYLSDSEGNQFASVAGEFELGYGFKSKYFLHMDLTLQ